MDISPLLISLKVAAASSVITFFLGILAARLVIAMGTAKSSALGRGKYLVDGLLSLPLVLPPTVVGFFLLVLLSKNSAVGSMLSAIGVEVIFTWQGAVIAAVVVSFPVMYRTARGALEQVDENLIYAARTLGMGEVKIFFRIMLFPQPEAPRRENTSPSVSKHTESKKLPSFFVISTCNLILVSSF